MKKREFNTVQKHEFHTVQKARIPYCARSTNAILSKKHECHTVKKEYEFITVEKSSNLIVWKKCEFNSVEKARV